MTIRELQEKRAAAWNQAKTFLDSKRTIDGLVSAEDSSVYDKMEADIQAYSKEIDRLERQGKIETELSRPTTAPITTIPQISDVKVGTASDSYRAAFWNALTGKPYLFNDLSEGVGSAGGYTVPTEFHHQIIKGLDEFNIIRSLATIVSTNSDRKIPVAATLPSSSWVEEGGTVALSNATFDQITLGAYKLATAIKVSTELLADSAFDLQSYVATAFARGRGNAEETAFISGSGTNQPTGIFDATNGGTLYGATAGAALSADDLINLVYALKSPYRKGACFLMNDATVASVRKLKDSNNNYLWSPSVQAGQPDKIFGFPVYTSASAPIATAGQPLLAFGDLKYYWVADRGIPTFQRLDELYAASGQIGFLATSRVDGKVILKEAIQLLSLKAAA
jgi:HK97 family phage major capsid protein